MRLQRKLWLSCNSEACRRKLFHDRCRDQCREFFVDFGEPKLLQLCILKVWALLLYLLDYSGLAEESGQLVLPSDVI